MKILILTASILYISMSLYLLVLTAEKLIPDLQYLYSILKSRFSSGSEVESGVEYAESPTPVKPKYDVDAFYERMRILESSVNNNFFEYELVPEEEDAAGVEVITNDYEIFLDKNRR